MSFFLVKADIQLIIFEQTGIRVLLFVNRTDYMATSESAGVRLAVHSATDFPFPDTFGYSAPVGFASSFGLKKVIFEQ